MELINWLATPEGVMVSHYGPQGVTWDYDENNKPYLTELGRATQADPNTEMPESVGGGLWKDGDNKIANTVFSIDEINPVSGERYNKNFWTSELSRIPTKAKKKWQEAMGALSEDEYLESHDYISISVNTDFVKDTRSPELEQIYKQVSSAIKEGTWKAVYAKSDVEFDTIVAEIIKKAKELGYEVWETYMDVKLGTINLNAGTHTVVVQGKKLSITYYGNLQSLSLISIPK